MVYETTIIIRNRSDKEKSIKEAIFAFTGGKRVLLIKGEGEEISTAVEGAEILKNRMYPRLEIGNVSLGSRPFFKNRSNRYNYRNSKVSPNKKDIISNIQITVQTRTLI